MYRDFNSENDELFQSKKASVILNNNSKFNNNNFSPKKTNLNNNNYNYKTEYNKSNDFEKISRNPHLNKFKNKRLECIPKNIMNIVTFLNTYNSTENINLCPIQIITKLKSNPNYIESQNDFDENNMNELPSPLIINNSSIYNEILNNYNKNYDNNKNQNIIEKTAFGDDNEKNDYNQQEKKFILKSQPNPNNILNHQYKDNFDSDDIDYKINNKSNINNYREKTIEFNNFKNGEKDVKIIQFNNIMVRSNKSSINYRNNKSSYSNNNNNNSYY